MGRNYKLTWQPGGGHQAGRWRKKYRGNVYYFPGGRGKSDRDAYQAALNAWEKKKAQVDAATPKPHEAEYVRAIAEWETVLAWCRKHQDEEMAVIAMETRRVMPHEETLVLIRSLDQDGVTKSDFYLSNGERETPDKELVRVAFQAHRIEEAIKRGKSETGLSHYEVRNWRGWHHHQILSLLASWFLVRETHREKKWTPAMTLPQIREGIAMLLRAAWNCDTPAKIARHKTRRLIRNEQARLYHHKTRNRLPPLRVNQRK